MEPLYGCGEQSYNRWGVTGKCAKLCQSPGVDGPRQATGGAALAKRGVGAACLALTHMLTVFL